jgi:hypothetical protein
MRYSRLSLSFLEIGVDVLQDERSEVLKKKRKNGILSYTELASKKNTY